MDERAAARTQSVARQPLADRRRRWRWPAACRSRPAAHRSGCSACRPGQLPCSSSPPSPPRTSSKRPDPLTVARRAAQRVGRQRGECRRSPRSDCRCDARAGTRRSTARRSRGFAWRSRGPHEYAVHSARNVIRLELTQPARATGGTWPRSTARPRRSRAAVAAGRADRPDAPAATMLERVRASRTAVGDDDHAERQRRLDSRRRDRGAGPAAPSRPRFSERLVEGPGPDDGRGAARQARPSRASTAASRSSRAS